MDYIIEQLKNLMAIDSPSGFTEKAALYVMRELEGMGYEPVLNRKGGVLVELGGKGNPLVLSAHIDTLGAMVAEVKSDGRLRLTPVGGLQPSNAETENCRVYTRSNGVIGGTMQLINASVHVNKEYSSKPRNYDTVEVILDEKAFSKEETEKLGVSVGDFVCFDTRTVITESGFIKSRFLDDKLSVAILLGYAKRLKDTGSKLNRKVYMLVTPYEEVGHGGAAFIPEDAEEMLCVDMGCVGEGLSCDEFKVSICAKDSVGPYDYHVTGELIRRAQAKGIDYAVDVYPYYGSDADAALSAGHGLRHGLIGAGVYASHGYERAHKEGVKNTLELIHAYTVDE